MHYFQMLLSKPTCAATTRVSRADTFVVQAGEVGPPRYRSPRHRMPVESIFDGAECGLMTWRAAKFGYFYGEVSGKRKLSPVPLEIKLEGEPAAPPLYGQTLDDAGIRNTQVAE